MDTVTATIGRGARLDLWVAKAIYQKMVKDIGTYYPNFGRTGQDAVQGVEEKYTELQQGLLYLHKHQTVVLLRMETKHTIKLVRASESFHPDREAARLIAEEINGRGVPCMSSAVLYIPFDSNNDSDLHVEAYHPDPDDQVRSHHYVKSLFQATITQSSSRDVQRMPGPSDLANPCDFCVASRIAATCGISMKQHPSHFSLKAWVGTAMHEKLERDLPRVYRFAQQEITVPIAEIQNFGKIKGHTDVFFPRKRAMSDWKSTDMKKLERIREFGVPTSHFGQTMLYMYGLRQAGYECDYATLTYIPRDSKNMEDIYVVSCGYRGDVALRLLKRTKSLLDRLKSGDVGSMLSDPDCFVCTVQPLLRR